MTLAKAQNISASLNSKIKQIKKRTGKARDESFELAVLSDFFQY